MDLAALKSELTTDPLARGYVGMSDEAAANRINVVDRPGSTPAQSIISYLMVNKSRTNAVTDLVQTSMLGRLILASQAAVSADPFGSGTSMTLDFKCSALALLEYLRNPNCESVPLADATLQQLLTDMVNAGVMRNPDKTAVIALANNQRSRGTELGFGTVTASDVANARRLP